MILMNFIGGVGIKTAATSMTIINCVVQNSACREGRPILIDMLHISRVS
jgi:hypothetical protein